VPYTITPSESKKYLIIKVVDSMTRESGGEQMARAGIVGAEMGIRRFLVDATESRNAASALSNYKVAHSDSRDAAVDRRARIAILVDRDDHSHDLYVTFAQTAGLDVTLFRSREDAIAHLEDEPSQRSPEGG